MNFVDGLQAAHSQLLKETSSSALGDHRAKAFRQFGQVGWPTRKNEDWKYTSLAALRDAEFAVSEKSHEPTSEDVAPYKLSGAQNIVLVNGRLDKTLSDLSDTFGLKIQSLEDEDFGAYLSSHPFKPHERTAFPLLNEAFSPALTVIEVDKEAAASRPLHLIHVSTTMNQDQPSMSCPWVFVRLQARSKLDLVESYVGFDGASCFCNSVTDIELSNSSKINHLRLHREPLDHFHIGSTRIHQGSQSECKSLVLSIGNQLLRHDLRVALREEGAYSTHNGIYLTRGEQHHDHHSWIVHEVGEGQSQQLYKGLLDDRARGVFSGKIVIEKGAQKASSEQLNNNLLLSRGAEVDSKPELEIYADDVKATHGSTTGQLNPEEVLYLQTRGIARSKAIQMISRGFALDLVLQLENPILREYGVDAVTSALSELHLEE